MQLVTEYTLHALLSGGQTVVSDYVAGYSNNYLQYSLIHCYRDKGGGSFSFQAGISRLLMASQGFPRTVASNVS